MAVENKNRSKKVILLNAPPSSGKGEVANFLWGHFYMNHVECKEELVKIAKVIAQMGDYEWNSLYSNRATKEVPTRRLFGRSPRQHLIYVAEEVIKPHFGKGYFGGIVADKLCGGYNVISDIGFMEEAMPIIDKVGQENVTLVRIHREGRDFSSESRGWLRGICDNEYDVYNDASIEDLFKKVSEALHSHKSTSSVDTQE